MVGHHPNCQPKSKEEIFVSKLEKGMLVAVRNRKRPLQVHRIGQALLHKVNDGSRNEYQNNAEFELWIQLVKSLQPLPQDYVIPF